MTSRRRLRLPAGAEAAVEELECLIRRAHPGASFEVRRGSEDNREVVLDVSAPGADPEAVLDLVMERLLEFQVERRLPVWVVPLDVPVVGGHTPNQSRVLDPVAVGAMPS